MGVKKAPNRHLKKNAKSLSQKFLALLGDLGGYFLTTD
jgi:hypothetical protein